MTRSVYIIFFIVIFAFIGIVTNADANDIEKRFIEAGLIDARSDPESFSCSLFSALAIN
jgi:hypothetical protein